MASNLNIDSERRFSEFVNKNGISGDRYDFALSVWNLVGTFPATDDLQEMTMQAQRYRNCLDKVLHCHPSDRKHWKAAAEDALQNPRAPLPPPGEAGELAKLREALQTGLEAAQQVAAALHENYKGYYQDKHESVDADVKEIQDAIAALPQSIGKGE